MTMNKTTFAVATIGVFLAGCSTTGPRSTEKAPPFECTSIHPEICELEEQFHLLRFEQAAQNAAIDAAERKRREQFAHADPAAAKAAPTEFPDPETTERRRHPAPL